MDLWRRQLSPAARAVWDAWSETEREQAKQSMRAAAREDDPDLALVVGEMQLASNRHYAGRSLTISVVGFTAFYVMTAIADSPWWLLGLVVPLILMWQAQRARPALQAGVANLRHAGAAGRQIALRYRERFEEWEQRTVGSRSRP